MDIAKIRKKLRDKEALRQARQQDGQAQDKEARDEPLPSSVPGTKQDTGAEGGSRTEEAEKTVEQKVPDEPLQPSRQAGPQESEGSHEEGVQEQGDAAETPGGTGRTDGQALQLNDAGREEVVPVETGDRTGEAQALSAPEHETAEADMLDILVFKVSNEDYAVRISNLQEILKKQRFTNVPRAPSYLLGITSVRGKILPVVDLRARLELSEDNEGKEKIIILSGEKEPIGILVGAVSDVHRVPEDGLLPPPSTLSDDEKRFIEAVVRIGDKFISILKADEILRMEEL